MMCGIYLRWIVSLLWLSTVLLRRGIVAMLASVSRGPSIVALIVPRWAAVLIIRHGRLGCALRIWRESETTRDCASKIDSQKTWRDDVKASA